MKKVRIVLSVLASFVFCAKAMMSDVRRLRRLLELQKELVDTDLVDKNNNEALDGVVRAVTKRCLDNEKILAAVTSFLVQDK